PASLKQPRGVHGPSAAVDLAQFSFTDQEWLGIPISSYIIYELHVGTFTTAGDLSAIINKLDHLLELGITAIEIMPVATFPGERNWGYDGVFPFSVQSGYGGPLALQKLVDACHQKGLSVILDVVYNHLGPEGNYFEDYGPYFTTKYQTPWGKAINFDDAYSDGVRHFFMENALMWLRDFHVDALRLDAVHAIKDLSAQHVLTELSQQVQLLNKRQAQQHYLIIECDLNDPKFIAPIEDNGFGMDAQWTDEFHHALRVAAGQERSGYYADFNGLSHLAKAYCDAYVYDGGYSEERKKTFGKKATGHPGSQFVVFSQNHDQIGNRMLGERSGTLYSQSMQKLLLGAVMVSPFVPLLFMGEEWGETNPFLYFVDHSDPDLIEAIRKGRAEEFAAFQFSGTIPDPADEVTFLQSKLQWELLQQQQHEQVFRFYKDMIHFRKSNPVLQSLERHQLKVEELTEQNVLLLYRWQGGHKILCFLNFSRDLAEVQFSDHRHWQLSLDSADPQYGGKNVSRIKAADEDILLLQPESILICTNHHV
ncbi:MAG: malto-oligosyltrehalose trehalohydrolase, partial [Pedobacter sp.]|nr:malto-oligosyltrehalose trehalohydrolase [Pedobacter sp.]